MTFNYSRQQNGYRANIYITGILYYYCTRLYGCVVMEMFGNNLKKYRQIKGYSQSEFAAELFVTRQCVSKWEKGITQPDLETLTRISELLGVSVDMLLKSDESATAKANTSVNKLFFIVNLLVALFCAIAFVALWRCLPRTVPAHWTNGEIDRYGDSAEILLNLISVVTFLIIDAMVVAVLKNAIKSNTEAFVGCVIIIFTHCVMIICQIAYLVYIVALYAKYLVAELSFATCLSAGLLLCVSISMHPKIVKQNRWLGIRTRDTLSSETVWNKTNALACYLCSGVSLVIIIVNLIIVSVWACIGLVAYVIPVVIAVIYSKSAAKAANEENAKI